jgi:drug/metabolite transporter (DMT)-like permease
MEVMRQLTAFTVAMAVNLEPVYAMGLAVLVFGEEERMGPYYYLGAAIMVGAVLTNGWLKRGARLSPR